MTASAAVLITAAVLCATLSSTYATRGILITAPRSFAQNGANKINSYVYDVGASGECVYTLATTDFRFDEPSKIIAQKKVDINEGEREKTVEMEIPSTSEYMVKLWANCTFNTDDGYSMTEQDEVYIHSSLPSIIIFIQTDKPLYKPGDQVKCRVLVVDRYLRPLGKDTQGDVWAEDVTGSRVAQWKNSSFGEGIQQFEFPLSEEPTLGIWRILAEVAGLKQSISFEVKEYVLPKFEVTVTPPSYVLANAETIKIKICAKYTYGKGVQGSMKINSTLEDYSWSNAKFPVLEHEAEINGCYDYLLNVSLVDHDYTHVYRSIIIFAQVTEDGTGVSRNATASIHRSQDALTIEFVNQHTQQYYKPGMRYLRLVKVTKPDKTPSVGEPVEVCCTISRQRVLQQWWATRKVKYCRNYTSNDDGEVVFCIPPQKTDAINMFVEAKALNYSSTHETGRPRLYQPQTSTTAQPYYSPNKTYLQVHNDGDTLQCGTTQTVKVFYTAKEGETYAFHYQVISKGEVVQTGSKDITFTGEGDSATSTCEMDLAVNDVRITLVPSSVEQGVPFSEDIDFHSEPVGIFEIDVDITAKFSPSFMLLVYYVGDDDEVVADSAKFEVEKCFQNKVEFQFGDEEKQPGAKTSVTLKASPNSICGTKVVDKSITLLDSSGEITKEKVFDELNKFDPHQYYRRDHCNEKFERGGKNKPAKYASTIFPPRPWSSSQYADSLTAFEDTGFVVLSDLKLLTRPCSKGHGVSEAYGGIALASVGVRGGVPAAPVPTRPNRPYKFKTKARVRPVLKKQPTAFADTERSSVNEGAMGFGGSATKSVVDIRSHFPETWLFDMQSVGEEGEIISKVTLPHTITEWLGNAVCINEGDGLGLSDTAKIKGFQAFFLGFTLPYSVIRGEKVPLIISTFNYLDKCLPISRTVSVVVTSHNGTIMSETSESNNVCVCGGKADSYTFLFTPTHVGNLNLTVSGATAEDPSVCGDKDIATAIARDKMTKSIEVEAEGFPQQTVTSFLFCPEDYEGSKYVKELNLSIPEDSVEGSERGYISLSGDIMGPTVDGLDGLVQLPTGCGEQNMVRFTPNIVAYEYLTATGKMTQVMKDKILKNLRVGYQGQLKYRHPDGSYSAFGVSDKEGSMWLSAFVLKSFSQAKKYIDISEEDISRTKNWILQKQQPDGCFPRVGKLFHEGMKGGVGSQGNKNSAPLTAYVLSSLLHSGYKNQTAIDGALTCMGTDTNLTAYTAALYAYVAALAGSPEAERYKEFLSQKKITEGDEVYWKNIGGSKSLDVETAAYAIMAIYKLKGEEGLPEMFSIVRRLTKLRNSRGGFISTQDTVVGIEACALFASLISKNPVDLTVVLNGGTLEETIHITEDDKLVVRKKKVPVVPSVVEVSATGTGCGLVQAIQYFNTHQPLKQKFFTLNIGVTQKPGCKTSALLTCTSYLPENQKSNMALVEIKMVSGYAANKESMDNAVRDVKLLKKWEINNNNAVFYFDELSNEPICFEFDVEEVSPVEDRKPATAKVYDYYAKEREESIDYTIAEEC